MIDVFDFERLLPTEHMMKWLTPEPQTAIRTQIDTILNQQVPGSILLGFRVTSEPDWLTRARPSADDPAKVILVSTGFAFEFELSVRSPEETIFDLKGVFSWVGLHLDDLSSIQHQTWLDLDGDLSTLGADGELKRRLDLA